jgi:hypothetical protein
MSCNAMPALNYEPGSDKSRAEKPCSTSTDTAKSVKVANAALIHSLALTHRHLWVPKRVYPQSPGPLHLLTASTQLDMTSAIVPPAAPRCSTLFVSLSRYFKPRWDRMWVVIVTSLLVQ